MTNLIRTYTITIGKVYNGEEECTSPHVELAGKQHIAVNCIDLEGCKYQVQLGPEDTEPCLTFFVTCEDCDVCGTTVIKKCFCESVDDCDECEICDTEGFCDKTCDTCCDGTCCECNEETPCTCNLVCQNGNCKCPAGTVLNANGCCDECATDSDCSTCEVCVSHGGYKSCELNDCNCDITGKCGEEGECVECLSSGHCPVNEVCDSNCECTCAPGYKRVNGICVPHECPNGDDDCEICEICSGEFCVPLQCPAGKVPAEVNGVCNCVQECNCAKPDCNSKFNYCGDSSIPGKCACLPCEGSCDAGCEDPCICDDDLNRCKFNPCFGSCESGLDCGPTCGCDNGTCVPCDSLDCGTEDDCTRALGCECTAAQKCAKDGGCDEAPCSVASDCNVGCTCDEGICQSCSNYSCQTSDCSDRDGCACNAGNCRSDSGECNDVATLEKDDDACELTATLTKDNCCQCPALTLDAKVTAVADVSGQKRVTYTAEVRKGDYDGVSVDSNPLVDDFDNDNIAENEPPISGTIKLSYVINYKTYSTVSGAYLGLSSANPFIIKKTYSATDGISQKEFIVDFPKIGTESTSGQIKSVVSSIDVVFSLDTAMSFENDCVYPAGTEIGTFAITSNETYLQTPIGSTITAPNCRKPFFKWTRFAAGSTVGDTFRKNYVDPISTGFYSETISGPTDAQSCYTYVFEPDCNCDDPVSKHIVFCNPSDFDKPVLTNCGKTYSFVIPATCSANITKYFELRINDVAVTVKGGKKFLLDTDALVAGTNPDPITSIVLHMICDTTAECDIEFTYDEKNVDPTPIGTCQADGTVDFTFPTLSTSIISVTFDGVTDTSSPFTFEGKEPNTDYDYTVVYSDGCISDVKTISKDDCCNDPEITCLSTGKYQVSSTSGFTGMTYNNLPIPSSGIITPPTTGSYSLIYTCGGVSKSITVLPYSQNNTCCNIIPRVSHEGTSVTVTIDSASTGGPFTVVVGSQSKTIATGGSDTFLAVPEGAVSLTITSTVNSACVYTDTINVSDCDLGLELTVDSDNCRLVASTDDQPCDCPNGKVTASASSIASYPGNKVSFGYTITPSIDDSTGVEVLSSTIKLYENGGSTAISTKNITSLSAYSNTAIANLTSTTSPTNIPFEGNILPCNGCDGGHPETQALHIYIASPYSLLSANGVASENLGGGHYAVYFSPPSASSTLALVFTNGTTNYNKLQSFSDILNPYFFTISTATYGTCSNVKFVYEVSLADGCAYIGETTKQICIGVSDTPVTINLTKTDSERDMEFILYEDDVQIRRDFEEDFEMVYTTDEVEFVPGSEYRVKAICGCEEEEETTECFDSTITLVDSDNCNRHFEIEIESCYIGASGSIYLATDSKGFTIGADGTTTVEFDLPTPLTTADVSVTIEYEDSTCSQTEIIGTIIQPEFTLTYSCDNPGVDPDYDVEISAEIDGDSVPVTILSTGEGTISGTSITNVTTDDVFYADVKLNNLAGCVYSVPIQSGCECNITSASITPSVTACVVNGVGSINLQLSTTRTSGAAAWKAVTSSGLTLVSSSTSSSAVNVTVSGTNLTTTLAPLAGSNTVTVYFQDVATSTTCQTKTFTINRKNLNYTTTANDCEDGFWSISITGLSSGSTVSGYTNNASITAATASKSFTISKDGCTSSVTVNRPSGCFTCNASNISFGSIVVNTEPCEAAGTDAIVHVPVTFSDGNCPGSSVTVGGVSATNMGSYWRAVLDETTSGSVVVIATDACGCTKETTKQINQNCCAAADAVSITQSSPTICLADTITATVNNLPAGYTVVWSAALGTGGSVNVTQGGTSTARTLTLTSVGGDPTSFQHAVQIKNGSTVCRTITVYVAIVDCPEDDVCAGYTGCPECKECYDNAGTPACQTIPGSDGDACTGGECCNGSCTPTGDLCVGNESCNSGCGYTTCPTCSTETCTSCFSISHLTLGNFTCDTGFCITTGSVVITKNALCAAFDADNIVNGTVPITTQSDGGGTPYGLSVTGGSIAGNSMTVNLLMTSCFDPEDFSCNEIACGETHSAHYAIIAGDSTCSVPVSVTLPNCSACSAC